jgi:hypothetical protein
MTKLFILLIFKGTVSRLTIICSLSYQVELGDAGQYECEMINELGSVKQASFLSVDGGTAKRIFILVPYR